MTENSFMVRRIIAAGAVRDKQGNLTPRDKQWLRATWEVCEKLSIRIADNPDIVVINKDDSKDFLDLPEGEQAELAVICNVRNPMNVQDAEKFSGFKYKKVSPRHCEPNAWENAAKRIGARYVVTHAASYPDPYDPLDHETEVTARMFANEYDCVYTQGNNIPVTWQELKDSGYDERMVRNLAYWKEQIFSGQDAANLSDHEFTHGLYLLYIRQRASGRMDNEYTRLGSFLRSWRPFHSKTEVLVRKGHVAEFAAQSKRRMIALTA